MEIYSLRPTGNYLQKNEGRQQRDQNQPADGGPSIRRGAFAEQLEDAASFSAVTPRELREMASESYASGAIDQDTYSQLSSQLPLEAVDPNGRIVDLSTVTDDTPFDFQDYYRGQLQIAENIGDTHNSDLLRSVVAYLGG